MRLSAVAMLVALAGALAVPASAQNGTLLAAWTQIGRGDAVLARAIVRGNCPTLDVDGRSIPMRVRAAPSSAFDVSSCEVRIPPGARRLSLLGRELPPPPQHVRTIAVLGDSGCRIELIFIQACNDPNKWPFPPIAKLIANARPDLVVHVGDYYYRETACLVPGCAGSPHGDNWAVWAADFFTPAAPMLAVAPVLAVRGNHEDCTRGGIGWDRFLSVYPYGACSLHEPAYATSVGDMRFFVLDSSSALDPRPSTRLTPAFRSDFARLRALPPATTWLVSHRPMWGVDATLTGATLAINRTLEAAEGNARTLPIELALSGHIHLFEALSFADHRPPQVIVGTGGDTLSNVPGHFFGESIDGTRVVAGAVRHSFGFAIFHLDRHTFDVYDRTGAKVFVCRYATGTL
ncbi:MAG: metallophosphoesterase family protein, partial [Vulcanimicrobiaceae bacterium]